VAEFRVVFVRFVATTAMVNGGEDEDEGGGIKAVAILKLPAGGVKPLVEVVKPLVEEVKPLVEVVKTLAEVVKTLAEVVKPLAEEEGSKAEGVGTGGVCVCPGRLILRGPAQLQLKASLASLYFGSGSPRILVRRRM